VVELQGYEVADAASSVKVIEPRGSAIALAGRFGRGLGDTTGDFGGNMSPPGLKIPGPAVGRELEEGADRVGAFFVNKVDAAGVLVHHEEKREFIMFMVCHSTPNPVYQSPDFFRRVPDDGGRIAQAQCQRAGFLISRSEVITS